MSTGKVRVRFVDQVEATLSEWQWTCEEPSRQELLQAMTPEEGPPTSDPFPESTLARELADVLQFEVVEEVPPSAEEEGEDDPDRVY